MEHWNPSAGSIKSHLNTLKGIQRRSKLGVFKLLTADGSSQSRGCSAVLRSENRGVVSQMPLIYLKWPNAKLSCPERGLRFGSGLRRTGRRSWKSNAPRLGVSCSVLLGCIFPDFKWLVEIRNDHPVDKLRNIFGHFYFQ